MGYQAISEIYIAYASNNHNKKEQEKDQPNSVL